MDQKLLQLMGYRRDLYPVRLERAFPRVLEEVALAWGTPGFEGMMTRLLLKDRPERQGFPPEVAEELFHLEALHQAQLRMTQQTEKNPWDGLPEDARRGTSAFDDGM